MSYSSIWFGESDGIPGGKPPKSADEVKARSLTSLCSPGDHASLCSPGDHGRGRATARTAWRRASWAGGLGGSVDGRGWDEVIAKVVREGY